MNVAMRQECNAPSVPSARTLLAMIGSEPAFARCLAVALGIDVEQLPTPDGDDPNVFWRQWLAGRNLGLVPIDDPASFAWPGYWIAAVEAPDGGRDAVLMFGVPSGPLLDPAGLLASGGSLVEGVLIAPFQLGLDPALPYGEPAEAGGVVAGLLVAPAAEAPARARGGAEAVAGRGLEGDRYASGRRHVLRHGPRLRADADRGGGARGAGGARESRSPGRRHAATSSPAGSG